MRFIVVISWAIAVLLVYEVRFPLDIGAAVLATGESFGRILRAMPGSLLAMPVTWVKLLWAVVIFVASQAACWNLGRLSCEWLVPGVILSGRLRWLVTIMLGWTVAGSCLLGAGLLGLFDRFTLGVVTTLLVAHFLLPRPLHSLWNWMLTPGYWSALFPPGRGRLVRGACYLSLLGIVFTGVCLLAPQTSYEDLTHHLAVASRAVNLHKLVLLESNFFFDLPSQTELLRGWSLALGGEPAARLWMLAALVMGASALFIVVEPLAGFRWAWVGAALWLTSTSVTGVALAGGSSLFLAPLFLAALALVMRPVHRQREAFLAGLLVGAALASSFFASMLAAGVPLVVLILNRDRRRSAGGGQLQAKPVYLKPNEGGGISEPSGTSPASPVVLDRLAREGSHQVVGRLFSMVAGIVVVAGPWLVKFWLLSCDSAYSFGGGISATAVAAYREHMNVSGLAGQYGGLLGTYVSPWTATMADGLSPFWLALGPFVLLGIRLGLRSRLLCVAGALGLFGWIAGPPQLDLGIAALAWFTAAVLVGLASHHAAERKVLTGIVAAVLVLQTLRLVVTAGAAGSLPAGLGMESPRSYFHWAMRAYAGMLDDLKNRLPSGVKVLVVGDARSYPSPREISVASIYEPFACYRLIRASGSVAELERRFRQLGVTHIVHNHAAALIHRRLQSVHVWESRDLSVWAEFWRLHVRLIGLPKMVDRDNGGYYIYRLARSRDRPLPTPTLPGIEEAFSSIEAHLVRGELDEASRKVRVLEGMAGDFPAVKYLIGTVWYADDVYRSYKLLREADSGGLRNLDLWRELSRLAEARWQVEEALMYEDRIARFEPQASIENRRRLLVRLATGATRKRKFLDAEKFLRKAMRLDPDSAALWAKLSEVLGFLKRRVGAEGAIREALRLDPDNDEYRRTLRRLLR